MKTKLLKKIRKRFVIKLINLQEGRIIKIFDLKDKSTLNMSYDTAKITDVLLSVCYSKSKAEKRRKRINFNKELKNL